MQTIETNQTEKKTESDDVIRARITARQARLDNPELWGLSPDVQPQHISKALAYKYKQSLQNLFEDALSTDEDVYEFACNMEGAMCTLETFHGNDVNLW